MTDDDLRLKVIRAFIKARANRMSLGLSELRDAVRIIDEHYHQGDESRLVYYLKLLWGKTPDDHFYIEQIWNEPPESSLIPREQDTQRVMLPPPQPDPRGADVRGSSSSTPSSPEAVEQQLQPLPLQSPRMPPPGGGTFNLQSYYPVTERFMAYMWRYIRRPIADGFPDVFDIEGTVKATSRTGCLQLIYSRRIVNHAQLIVFLDQHGSMMPFHRYLREMVETIRESPLDSPEIYYFNNTPAEHVWQTPYRTQPVPRSSIVERMTATTSVLIVSDAGAARGQYISERVRMTYRFLNELKARTEFVAWLNPMPEDRWIDSSAESIANVVHMFQMNEYGFSNAIDVLSGRGALLSSED